VALYTPWLSSQNIPGAATARSKRAEVVLAQIIDKVKTNIVERQCFLGRNPEDVSPWGLFFAYRVCAAHIGSFRDTSGLSEVLSNLRDGFQAVDVRWNVEGRFSRIKMHKCKT
jgi:hypothetical protein